MNRYQIIAVILTCFAVFALVVGGLTLLGVPILIGFLGVYLSTIWFMLGLQRRALQSSSEMQGCYANAMRYERAVVQQKTQAYANKTGTATTLRI